MPDRGNDFVFRDHVITVLDKMDEEGKHLRLKPYLLIAAAELKSLRVESKVAE